MRGRSPVVPDQDWRAASAEIGWAYWRPAVDGIVELGTVRGFAVGLPQHFHAEDQLTFVVSGRRSFIVRGEAVVLSAGEGILIPAGVTHRSLAEPSGVACLNAYVPAGGYDDAAMIGDVGRLWRTACHVHAAELAAVIRQHHQGAGAGILADSALPVRADRREAVSRTAARAGMSREGFSRRFARRHGLPPHAFWLMARLNQARAVRAQTASAAD